MVMTTGGLHEDGLADMADGFGSHKGAEEIARIMKDSVIGSYGTIALICLFFMRWTSILPIEMTMASPASFNGGWQSQCGACFAYHTFITTCFAWQNAVQTIKCL